MPFVEGESLRDRLSRETQLPVDEALRIVAEVAEALGLSHSQGIIHRDIKPENILLSDGHAVVADFGIARAVTAAGGEKLTQTGMAVGTPEYMSPEQASGMENLDPRTDIYSLACVLYELLAGENPYAGPTALAIIAKKMADPIPSVRRVRSAVPEAVDTAIMRALEKVPADRFRSAEQFVSALTADAPVRPSAVSVDKKPKSIAVLPFEDLSPEGDQQYFVEGLSEEVINALSQIPDLKVAARTSTFLLAAQGTDIATVASTLGVANVLEGSVRKEGDQIRVAATLIEAESGFQLWSDTYNRELTGVFAIQDEIARAIAGALKVTLAGEAEKPLVTVSTTSSEAYEEYLRGRFFWNKRTEQTIRTAIEHFQGAIALDSTYALAYAGLADAYNILPIYVPMDAASWRSTLERARAAAERALELDPTLASAHTAVGLARQLRLDWIGAERAYRRALELDPNYAMAHHWYAIMLSASGRLEEALGKIRTAQRLDPLSIIINASFCYILFLHREYQPAIRQLEATIELDSAFPTPWFLLGMIYLETGHFDDAASAWKSWAVLAGRDTLTAVESVWLAAEHARTGRPAQLPDRFEPELPFFEQPAGFYALVGHSELALSRLNDSYQFYEEGGGWFIWSLKDHPWLDPLRSDPRFIEFLRKIGVQP